MDLQRLGCNINAVCRKISMKRAISIGHQFVKGLEGSLGRPLVLLNSSPSPPYKL